MPWQIKKIKCWIKSVWFAIIGKNWHEITWKECPPNDEIWHEASTGMDFFDKPLKEKVSLDSVEKDLPNILFIFRKENGIIDAYSIPVEKIYGVLNSLPEEEKLKLRPHEL